MGPVVSFSRNLRDLVPACDSSLTWRGFCGASRVCARIRAAHRARSCSPLRPSTTSWANDCRPFAGLMDSWVSPCRSVPRAGTVPFRRFVVSLGILRLCGCFAWLLTHRARDDIFTFLSTLDFTRVVARVVFLGVGAKVLRHNQAGKTDEACTHSPHWPMTFVTLPSRYLAPTIAKE